MSSVNVFPSQGQVEEIVTSSGPVKGQPLETIKYLVSLEEVSDSLFVQEQQAWNETCAL